MDADRFAQEYWGEKPLLHHEDDGFADLFSASAVDELIADRGLRTPFVRMASQGQVLSPSTFTSPGGAGAEIADQVDSTKVLTQFAQGATLVLQGLHRTWAPVARFTRRLVVELGHPVQVNAYVTPASSRGFDPHYDTHDVFVVQIAGTKRWSIHEPVHRHPLVTQPWDERREEVAAAARHEPAIDAVLAPGDVLYLPRGWIHSAVAQGQTSIHLTFGVRARTRQDVLRLLLAAAEQEPELRAPLALGVDHDDPETLRADVEATVTAARQLLGRQVDVAALSAQLGTALARDVRPDPVRPLATTELIAGLDEGTVLQWRDALSDRVIEDARGVHVVTRCATVSLPAEAGEAVKAIRAAPQRAGSLPGLDTASSLTVARRLLREGVVIAP